MVKKGCKTSRCTHPVGMVNCQLAADTSCKEALFEYRFQGFEGPNDQKVIIQVKYPDYAWFTYAAYDDISFSYRDTVILSRDSVCKKLLDDDKANKAPVFTEKTQLSPLGLLNAVPKHEPPLHVNGFFEINPISKVLFDHSKPRDFPMLGYFYSTEEYQRNGETRVVQYWVNARNGEVIRKTTYSYSLIDE